MKLCILCNFGPYYSGKNIICGGSEKVIREISERLVLKCNYEIDIYAYNYKKVFRCNNINLFPCPKGDDLISRIAHYDHIFVYSDSSWSFDTLLRNIEKVGCRISCALVGAYYMQSHPEAFKLLKKNLHRFNIITHSKMTSDYKWCINNDLSVKVIPNGVDLLEFNDKNNIDFKNKYNIKEQYIILSVFSYFYGKGFELLPKIARKLSSTIKDFLIVQLSNTVDYPYDKIFLDRTKRQAHGTNIRFMRDLPREDVISAFKCSDLLLSVSKKEVAPLVILESRAAKLPYVSLNTGNVLEQPGGIPIHFERVDNKGYAVVDEGVISRYSTVIYELLMKKELKEDIIREGQENIEEIDWKNIIPLYHEVFNR